MNKTSHWILALLLCAANAAKGSPDSSSNSDDAVIAPRYQKAIAPYIAAGVGTFPEAKKRYLSGLPRTEMFFVSARVSRVAGLYALAIVKVTGIDEGRKMIFGIVQNDVGAHTGYKKGSDISFPESDLIDWKITHAASADEGDVVGKYLASLAPDTNIGGILADQRDVDLAKIQVSKAVEGSLGNTFMRLFDDKGLKLEEVPSSVPAIKVWPSLFEKYRGLSPDALKVELQKRASDLAKTDKVTIEDSVFEGKRLILVAAYAVLRKGDVLFEVSQYLHFDFTDKGRLDRISWGLRAGRWMTVPPKAGPSTDPKS